MNSSFSLLTMNNSINRKEPLIWYLLLRFRAVFFKSKEIKSHETLFSFTIFMYDLWKTFVRHLQHLVWTCCTYNFPMLFFALRLHPFSAMRTLNDFCMLVLKHPVANLWNVLCVYSWEINPLELNGYYISSDITVDNWVLPTQCVCVPLYSYNTETFFKVLI